MTTIAIIQARMSSSRLPGKVLLPLAGYPVLWHVHHRLSSANRIIEPTEIKSSQDIAELSVSDLETLANKVREFLIKSVSETGGHIGANLGTVDLSIALHKSFESPRDKFIFDTGHQGYTHKY